MESEASDKIEHALRGNHPVQLTGGTPDDRRDLIQQHYPTPLLDADCEYIDDSRKLARVIAANIWPSVLGRPDDIEQRDLWGDIEHHLTVQDGALVIYNFDDLDDDTARTAAQHIKGLYEQTDAAIAVTADESGALFQANPDLTGRVRTITLPD